MSDTKILDAILEMLETNENVDWDDEFGTNNPWEEFSQMVNYIKTRRGECNA